MATVAVPTDASTESNGAAKGDLMVDALVYEQAIGDEAAEIRGDAKQLTPELFMQLWPLLKRPIPLAYIQTVPKTTGKPYDSTGIRSVQVQIDRMNNVLTPMWWWDKVSYEADGKLAFVTVCVGNRGAERDDVFVIRRSSGGVDRGSTQGNVYKGSYTNAAKLAFARLGVGHEVYVGATDLDPDVDPDAAESAEKPASGIGKKIARGLVDRAWTVEAAKTQFQLAASHAKGADVGSCDTKPKAIAAIEQLTFEQAQKLERWVARKEAGGEDG